MLEKALATLPPTLDEIFERILCAIDQSDSEYAIRILRWLVFSERPLLVEELAEVAAIDAKRIPAFNRQEVLQEPFDVLNICSSLVTVGRANRSQLGKWVGHSQSTGEVIRLAHSSIKEYLISEQCRLSRATRYSMDNVACNRWIAKNCLEYLLQFQYSHFSSVEQIKQYKLARYAAVSWMVHAQAGPECEDALSQPILQLFSTEKCAFLNWLRIYDPDYPWSAFDINRKLETVQAPLYYASLFGLAEVVQALISESGADVNTKGGRYGSALQAASNRGHEKVVSLLLSEGANINAKGGRYGDALQAASHGGHRNIVELLLVRGADVNTKGGLYGSALQAASFVGHEKVVELLLDKGADVDAQSGLYGTALQAASFGGHEKIIELLLGKGADINAQGGLYGNALQAASHGGLRRVVKLLLYMGSDVNTPGGEYGNALQAAAFKGNKQIVELLLSKGANINARGGLYGNSLQAASYGGHRKVVKLLLDRGADINAQGGEYVSALHAALHGRNEPGVRLSEKLDSTAPDRSGRSQLNIAAGGGHIDVTKMLLNRGADLTVPNEDGEMPLHSATLLGDLHFLEVLLSLPINVNALCRHYGTALHAAAIKGHLDILRMLVEIHNADVTVTDQLGRTPLHLAARGGDIRCVDYLIGRGLRCSDKDNNGNSVIHYACSGASIKVVRRTLYHHPIVISSPEMWTPLHWAYRTGDHELVNLLLQHGYHESSIHTAQPLASWTPVSIGLFHRNPHFAAREGSLVQESAVSSPPWLNTGSHSNSESKTDLASFHHENYSCDGCFHVSIRPVDFCCY